MVPSTRDEPSFMPPTAHHPCKNDQCMSRKWVEDHGVFAPQTPMWTNARKRIVKKRNERDFASSCRPNIIISGFKAVHAISRADFFMGCQCCAMYHSDRSQFARMRVSWTPRDQEAKNQSIEPYNHRRSSRPLLSRLEISAC